MADRDLQARVADLIARPAAADDPPFSQFDMADSDRASELSRELTQIAADEGLERAVEHAEQAAEREPVGRVKFGLKLFITHDPTAAAALSVPTPELRETEALPEAGAPAEDEAEGDAEEGDEHGPFLAPPAPTPVRDISRTTPEPESRLDWYREDPLANDHHHHWHLVYPRGGVAPGPNQPTRTQPRQGELFFYMHEQMLARYDTERVIAGLDPVQPLGDYAEPVPEGYELQGYGQRPAGLTTDNDDPNVIARLDAGRAEADEAIRARELTLRENGGSVPLDENTLGSEVESSLHMDGDEPVPLQYLNLHGNGHVLMSGRVENPGPNGPYGPMRFVETAIMDPVFYRWHRFVDDYYAATQEALGSQPLADHAADVAFRKDGDGSTGDIALVFARDIEGSATPGFDFRAWGEEALGLDLEKGGPLTDELLTGFARSSFDLPRALDPEWLTDVVHLTHEPFVYFLRIENPRAEIQPVTVRIFVVHADHAGERRWWIELDKFRADLEPGVNLVAQPDARSSVIKRKGLDAPGAEHPDEDGSERGRWWCDCGWPYSLLLPSGSSEDEGTPFRLAVTVTDWARDDTGQKKACGSMSFCGARDDYPDRRLMGYPFNRPFERSIAETIAAEPNMAARDVTIRCTTERPGAAA